MRDVSFDTNLFDVKKVTSSSRKFYIAAHSPQAKGRIERFWQTLQDRLVSELRLRGISTLEAANAFLPAFLADLNPRFARVPAVTAAAWRPVPRDLAAVLSCRYTRTVARDNTVRLGPRWVQLPRRRSYAGRRVEVREALDGRLLVFIEGRCVTAQPAPALDFVLRPRRGPSGDRRARLRAAAQRLAAEAGRYPPSTPKRHVVVQTLRRVAPPGVIIASGVVAPACDGRGG